MNDEQRIIDGNEPSLRELVVDAKALELPGDRVDVIRARLRAELDVPVRRPRRRLAWVLAAAAVLLVGVAAAALRWSANPTPAPPAPSAVAPPPTASVEPPPSALPPAPSVTAPTTAAVSATPPPPAPKPVASEDAFVIEDRILRDARAALATDPARALTLTEEHARRYPHGMLSQEREVIAIEALAKQGRTVDAKTRASAFERAYPNSAYRARVAQLVGDE